MPLIDEVAQSIRVKSWPEGVDVPATQTIRSVAGTGDLGNGAQGQPGYTQIEVALGSGLDGNNWYAISLGRLPAKFRWLDETVLYWLDGNARGVRLSPTHPPVIASVTACATTVGTVAVYVRFSEQVTKAPGSVVADYGAGACTAGEDFENQSAFSCSGDSGTEAFVITISGSIVSQSGSTMPPGTLRSGDLQASQRLDGCVVYKPSVPGS